jgi:hypothetical protein
MDNKRKKKVNKKEHKLPTKLTMTGIHSKSKLSKTTISTNKLKNKNNVDENKISHEKKEEKSRTDEKINKVKIEKIIEKEKYIPFSCIPSLEDKNKDLTHNHELIP